MNYRDNHESFSLGELTSSQEDLEKYVDLKAKKDWWDSASMFFCGFFLIFLLLSFFGFLFLFVASGISFALMCICIWYTEYISSQVKFYAYGIPTWNIDAHRIDLEEAIRRKLRVKPVFPKEDSIVTLPENIISVDFSARDNNEPN